VHGEIGAAFRHRRFQFLHEQSLAADARERGIEDLIALGGHASNSTSNPGCNSMSGT